MLALQHGDANCGVLRKRISDQHLHNPHSPYYSIFQYMARSNLYMMELENSIQGTENTGRIIFGIVDKDTDSPQLFIPTIEEFHRYASYPIWAINKLQEPQNNITARIMASRVKNIKYYAEANFHNDYWSVMFDLNIIKKFPTRSEAVAYIHNAVISCTLVPPRGFGIE